MAAAAAVLLLLSPLSERHGCRRGFSVADVNCGMQEAPLYLAPMMLGPYSNRGGWLP